MALFFVFLSLLERERCSWQLYSQLEADVWKHTYCPFWVLLLLAAFTLSHGTCSAWERWAPLRQGLWLGAPRVACGHLPALLYLLLPRVSAGSMPEPGRRAVSLACGKDGAPTGLRF